MRYNFNLKYTQNDFIDFLRDDFLPKDFKSDIEALDLDFQSKYIDADQCQKIGYSESLELPVLEIWHNSEHDPRVGISKELFRLMGNFGYSQVLAVFVSTNSNNYRLSLATVELEAKGKKIKRTYSNPKRYSFFLGPDAKTRTPEDFLLKKGRVKDFDDLLKRFSIEVVNKEFYDSIAKLFTDLVGGERGKGNNKYTVSKEDSLLKLPSTNDDQTRKEFAVRLIGRILFSWFLKKKKSANGISLLSDEILSVEAVKNSNNYYHDNLEPLFFEVLNTPIEARKEEFKQKPWDLTPFLNGGLFEPLDGIDFYKYNDAALKNTLLIPNTWFYDVVDGKETGLLSLFETYNFTIDESTSTDIDLSIDPEMLGRVFENLLAEINPETGESARKSSGSFYTPRPIVEYMVDESIKQYLLTKTEIQKERIENLLSIEIDDVDFDDTERSDILKAINEVKILDPACGSGAFPMGVLQKLVEIVNKIDPDNLKWKEEQKEKEIGDKIRKLKEDIDFANQINDDEIRNTAIQQIEHKLYEIDHNFEIKNADYLRKLYLISNCIYGVDIQEIAVEISKLRCFLSLIVDEKVIDDSSNCGIYPLPNLEFKFVAANTLIGLDDSVKNLFTSDINSLEKELKSYMEAYYSADNKEKKLNAMESYNGVREEINGKIFDQIQSRNKGLQNKIYVEVEKIEQIKSSVKNGKINSTTQKRLNSLEKKIDKYKKQIHENSEMASSKGVAAWDPFSHSSSSWFDSEWMFGIKDGFDIVIGNPPYVEHKKLKHIASKLKGLYQVYTGSSDLSVYFFEKAIKLAKNRTGIVSFISTNKFFHTDYGRSLREFILQYQLINIVDFEQVPIFENVLVSTAIIILSKQYDVDNMFEVSRFVNENDWNVKFRNKIFGRSVGFNQYNFDNNEWNFLQDNINTLRIKISSSAKLIKDIDSISIKRGITTGCDDAFIIDLITATKLQCDIIEPLLKGSDIKKYQIENNHRFIINAHNGIKHELSRILVQSNYPNIYKYLINFDYENKNALQKRSDKGDHWTNLRSCAFLNLFKEEKIVWALTSDKGSVK